MTKRNKPSKLEKEACKELGRKVDISVYECRSPFYCIHEIKAGLRKYCELSYR